jgi:hypothetical protein
VAETTHAPKDLIGFLDYYLVQKAPVQIPQGGREWLVKYGPWILVVLLVLTLPLILFVLGIGTVMMVPFGAPYAAGFGIAAVLTVVGYGLSVAALPGLFARRRSGWTLLFYAELVSIVSSLVVGSIIGGLVFGLIWLYVLFQIRTMYH